MSLLLEALKKAEKAKEEAERRARAEPSGEPEELQADGDASVPPTKPTMTRDRLPQISQPLEILSDDISPKPAAPLAMEPRPEPASAEAPPEPPPLPEAETRPQPARSSAPQARRAQAAAPEAGRAAARKVFEAKFKEPNPRLPFYLTMGGLSAFALGTVVYFWMQWPRPPIVHANPSRPAGEPVAVVEAKPAATPANSSPAAIPGMPGTPAPATTPAAAPAAVAPAPAASAPPFKPAAVGTLAAEPRLEAAPRLAPRAPAAPPAPVAAAARAPAAPLVNPKVESGYAAFRSGDSASARAAYQEVLADDPGNRDALLGIAALDVRAGRLESAEAIYVRLLQADPRDSQAQAALIALRGSRVNPQAAESRLKTLLAGDPQAHVLNFTLGNQLAQQGRWAEAQQEYFKAVAAEPDNADFAYNLAVALDHMRQAKLALQYYQRAIALAKTRGASFDLAMAESRAAQLAR